MDSHELYVRLTKKYILEYVEQGKEEDLHLDYKLINSPDFTNKDDKKNYAKALSGYANSDGGIIIWGIDARRNSNGINCAIEVKGISDAKLFLTKLIEFSGQFVSPIVDNVEHKIIKIDRTKAVVGSYIPASDIGPHMAKAGEDRYYKRSGDSFYKMEHFDIEDMFGRRKKPILRLCTAVKKGGEDRGPGYHDYRGIVRVYVENIGRGIAKYTYLAFTINSPYQIYHGMSKVMKDHQGKYKFTHSTDSVIHPGTMEEMALIEFGYAKTQQTYDDLIIQYEIVAQDAKIERGSLVVKGAKMAQVIMPSI